MQQLGAVANRYPGIARQQCEYAALRFVVLTNKACDTIRVECLADGATSECANVCGKLVRAA